MVICNIFKKKRFWFDIDKFGFESIDDFQEDFEKEITSYKSGELFEYYSAYYNIGHDWIIKRCINMGPATQGYETMDKFQKIDKIQETIIFYGKIPNKKFGEQLMSNIGIKNKNDTQT